MLVVLEGLVESTACAELVHQAEVVHGFRWRCVADKLDNARVVEAGQRCYLALPHFFAQARRVLGDCGERGQIYALHDKADTTLVINASVHLSEDTLPKQSLRAPTQSASRQILERNLRRLTSLVGSQVVSKLIQRSIVGFALLLRALFVLFSLLSLPYGFFLLGLLNSPSGLLFSKSSRCLFCMPSLFFSCRLLFSGTCCPLLLLLSSTCCPLLLLLSSTSCLLFSGTSCRLLQLLRVGLQQLHHGAVALISGIFESCFASAVSSALQVQIGADGNQSVCNLPSVVSGCKHKGSHAVAAVKSVVAKSIIIDKLVSVGPGQQPPHFL
mmetsp:Transcript_33992/g.66948  ORF Transcript_33992/g.66948 Transcript_33992/m.66948 type:complete len:327 (+) Transcript_33992:1561-2541(+)